MLHIQPTLASQPAVRIPPTQSVDASYPTYISIATCSSNPTDAVGGCFIHVLNVLETLKTKPVFEYFGFFQVGYERSTDSVGGIRTNGSFRLFVGWV